MKPLWEFLFQSLIIVINDILLLVFFLPGDISEQLEVVVLTICSFETKCVFAMNFRT